MLFFIPPLEIAVPGATTSLPYSACWWRTCWESPVFSNHRYNVCDGILITQRWYHFLCGCCVSSSSPDVICWNVLVDWQRSHRARNGRVPHGRWCPEQVRTQGDTHIYSNIDTHSHAHKKRSEMRNYQCPFLQYKVVVCLQITEKGKEI